MEQIVDGAARDFGTIQSSDSKEYFVYFERLNCRIGAKDPLSGGKPLQEYLPVKRERGEYCINPAVAPVSLMSADSSLWSTHTVTHIRRTEPCGP